VPARNEFGLLMLEARSALLLDPDSAGEDRARAAIRRFLTEAGTPSEIVEQAEEYLLDLAYRGHWKPRESDVRLLIPSL
jgi:hypothetical protein